MCQRPCAPLLYLGKAFFSWPDGTQWKRIPWCLYDFKQLWLHVHASRCKTKYGEEAHPCDTAEVLGT